MPSDVQLLQEAIDLVLRDVRHELGELRLTVMVGHPDEVKRQLHERFPQRAAPHDVNVLGWVLEPDGSAIGFPRLEGLTSEWLLVRVADTIQEAIIESAEHWGTPFPLCRTHGVHPMNPEVVDNRASWVCSKGFGPAIAIGTLSTAWLARTPTPGRPRQS